MTEIMYLREENNKIICTKYSGRNLEPKRSFIVRNFKLNNRVVDISINKKRLYVLLNNDLVLIFKNIDILKHEAFKELAAELKFAYLKYYTKRFATVVNFHVHKLLNKKNISLSSLAAIALAGTLSITNVFGKTHQELTFNSAGIEKNNHKTIAYEKNINNDFAYETNKPAEKSLFENMTEDEIEEGNLEYKDTVTNEYIIADSSQFYSGAVYNELVAVMNDPEKTAEMNKRIQDYICENLAGQMWANAENQGYNDYTIPEKYKNGKYTLNELFDDASQTFDIPKDILVSISQHECGQGYYPLNSYTQVYEKNCGGMMGFLDVNGISTNHLPEGTTSGLDLNTNPAISIYAYASIVRFFYDSFKNIDIGYGFDSWDISVAMIAIGPGDVANINVGFNYRQDYDEWGWSQLNICAPQFKALREAYLNNLLGVNDLTLTVENGVVTHWSDGEMFYYKDGEKTFDKMNNSVQTLSKNK